MAEKLIKMKRAAEADSGPTTADVHPDEVGNYQQAGWEIDSARAEKAAQVEDSSEAREAPAKAKSKK